MSSNFSKFDIEILSKLIIDAPIGFGIFDINDKTKIYLNDEYENLLGFTKEEIIDIGLYNLSYPDDQPFENDLFEKIRRGIIDSYKIEKRFIRKDGKIVWLGVICYIVDRVDYNNLTTVYALRNIDDKKRAQEELKESERNRTVFLNNLPGVAYRCKPDKFWTMEYISKGCYELTGYEDIDFINNNTISFVEIILKKWQDVVEQSLMANLSNKKRFKKEYQIITKSGKIKWVYDLGEGVYDEKGNLVAIEGIIIDIASQKKNELALKRSLNYDKLTNLPNRYNLIKTYDKNNSTQFKNSLIVISFLEFSSLISKIGVKNTNDLLINISKDLKKISNVKNQLFRNHEYGMTFYILNNQNEEKLISFCESIRNILIKHVIGSSNKIGIGIVSLTSNLTVDEALQKGVIAASKSNELSDKRINYAFFNEHMANEIIRENILSEEYLKLSRSDENLGLYLNFQPIVDAKTLKVTGFESLARYNSDTLGFISPLEMIPLLEKKNLIREIGDKIIDIAFSFLRELNTIDEKIFVTINLSNAQLFDSEFLEKVINLADINKINLNNVVFEITETVYSYNFNYVNNIIKSFKDNGVKFAIDDFGIGYSSLSRIVDTNVSCIKIDKTFTKKLVSSEKTITKEIIDISKKLEQCVIVEGIETNEEAKVIENYDVDCLQGYYFSKPLFKEDAIKFLKERNKY